ncbi:MAG TPA: methyltransferase domain-containing protein, partial [Candidatus Binatia bacterium]|nr:methyltransferase domain-containing protein [Candidatus Binatia bacterium]
MLFETYPAAVADKHIKALQAFIKEGLGKEQMAKSLKLKDFEELYSVAKARLASKKTSQDYFMTEEDLRFATNEQVAAYRAKRLACTTLVDIGCGVGIQTLAFAKTCKNVIAIDIDPRKVRYAQENARKFGVKNVEFVCGDGLEALKSIEHADVIFVDPERAPEEDVRDIAKSFKPDLLTLVKSASKVTPNIAIELPPQIHEVPFDCEREYVSFNHELNRLTVYLGKLKRAKTSAVIIPGNHVLQEGKAVALKRGKAANYLYEIDPAVAKAGLAGMLADEGMTLYRDERELLFTSATLRESPFFKARYEVIDAVENQFDKILAVLKRENAGKVLFRAKIDPQQYWKERNKYEKALKGEVHVTLFLFKDEALICKKLE